MLKTEKIGMTGYAIVGKKVCSITFDTFKLKYA